MSIKTRDTANYLGCWIPPTRLLPLEAAALPRVRKKGQKL